MVSAIFFSAVVLGLIGGLISTAYSGYARQVRWPVGEWFDGATTVTLIGFVTGLTSLISLFLWVPTLYALGAVVAVFFGALAIVQALKSASQFVALVAIVASWVLGAVTRFLI